MRDTVGDDELIAHDGEAVAGVEPQRYCAGVAPEQVSPVLAHQTKHLAQQS